MIALEEGCSFILCPLQSTSTSCLLNANFKTHSPSQEDLRASCEQLRVKEELSKAEAQQVGVFVFACLQLQGKNE